MSFGNHTHAGVEWRRFTKYMCARLKFEVRKVLNWKCLTNVFRVPRTEPAIGSSVVLHLSSHGIRLIVTVSKCHHLGDDACLRNRAESSLDDKSHNCKCFICQNVAKTLWILFNLKNLIKFRYFLEISRRPSCHGSWWWSFLRVRKLHFHLYSQHRWSQIAGKLPYMNNKLSVGFRNSKTLLKLEKVANFNVPAPHRGSERFKVSTNVLHW